MFKTPEEIRRAAAAAVQEVELAAEATLEEDHARVEQRLVEVDPVERQVGVGLVVDDVRLADEEEIEPAHRRALRVAAASRTVRDVMTGVRSSTAARRGEPTP